MNIKIVIGCILLLVAPLAAIGCFFSFQSMQASNDWPSAPGVITVSEVQSTFGKKTKAKLSYEFQVGASSFNGSRIRFADTTGSSRSAQEQSIAAYPVGSNVEVYYDPKNPKVAVLEPGGGIRGYGLILPPLLLAGIGAFLIFAGIEQKKIAKKKQRARSNKTKRTQQARRPQKARR